MTKTIVLLISMLLGLSAMPLQAKTQAAITAGYALGLGGMSSAEDLVTAASGTGFEKAGSGLHLSIEALTEVSSNMMLGGEIGFLKLYTLTWTDSLSNVWTVTGRATPVLISSRMFMYDRIFGALAAGYTFGPSQIELAAGSAATTTTPAATDATTTDTTTTTTTTSTSGSNMFYGGGMTFVIGGGYSWKLAESFLVEPSLKIWFVDLGSLIRITPAISLAYSF